MRIRRLGLALAVLIIPATARADDHRADRFAGASFAKGSKLVGLHVTDAITYPKLKSLDLSILGDLSVHFGSESGADLTRVTYMGGVRWTFAPDASQNPKILPFVQGLLGGVYRNHAIESGNDLGIGVGVGVDWVPDRGGPRQGWAFRAQLDYVKSGGDDFPRGSVGLVYRFPRPPK